MSALPKLFHFDDGTPEAVQMIVKDLYATRERVRFFFGHTAESLASMTRGPIVATDLGKAWPEENDVCGHVGRSTGPKHIPLLISRRNSSGGPALSTRSIVAILGKGGWKYKHPQFSTGQWDAVALVGSTEFQALHNRTLHAGGFRTLAAAERYCAFMRGERMGK